MLYIKLNNLIVLTTCCIFNACVSTKTSDRYRVAGLEPKQEQSVTYQGQALMDILGVFIEQQTGLSSSLILSITNGSTIYFVDNKFDKIERYKDEEYRLNQELLSLGKELDKLKVEYQVLQKALSNLRNLKESKRRELKSLNNKYGNSVRTYQDKLVKLEKYIQNSNKIIKKQVLLNKIEEYKNELDNL